MRIAIVCGGAGAERGVSINSARSVMDHLRSDDIEIVPFYFDVFMNTYLLSLGQLYSNTPSDFDFKLQHSAQKISREEFITKLKELDLVFPLIHGIFGEDGQFQQLLEDNGIPYVGGSAQACKTAFPKHIANSILKENGFYTIPFTTVDRKDLVSAKEIAAKFFEDQKISRAIIKPVLGGSSIGVYDIKNADEAVAALQDSIAEEINVGDIFMLEPFCKGREFTSIVLQNSQNEAVSFVPTEVQIVKGGELFDFRDKYLPTDASLLHCPPRFTDEQIKEIQRTAEKIFTLFGFNDYLRFDGWVLDDGRILFSDINPVTGMEQCSFVFEQTARAGFTHATVLRYIVANACRRYGLEHKLSKKFIDNSAKKKVFVLMGGRTAEREVSLMSGTNIWLKLLKSKYYQPSPFLIDRNFDVWSLPYSFTLNRTVEEIYLNCLESKEIISRMQPYADEILKRLGITEHFNLQDHLPQKMSLDDFCKSAVQNDAFVFIGLHGGEGENGSLQDKLDHYGLCYNGSDAKGSRICMDKYKTGEVINALQDPDVYSLPKRIFNITNASELSETWQAITAKNNFDSFAIKPIADGCSSGIIRISDFEELKTYVEIAANPKNDVIPAHTFRNQDNEVSLPQDRNPIYIIEPFVQVDYLRVIKNDIVYKKYQGWLELTVGVLEKSGEYHSLNPSITIAEGEVLSLEEKFQGGTGVNITPPPEDILKAEYRAAIMSGVEKVAKALGIKSYARIDIFFNVESGKMIIIEANSLPGMTPSTVIYHQALKENPSLPPIKFIERIIGDKLTSNRGSAIDCCANA